MSVHKPFRVNKAISAYNKEKKEKKSQNKKNQTIVLS